MAKEIAKPQVAPKPAESGDADRMTLIAACLTGLLSRAYPDAPEVAGQKACDYADAALAAANRTRTTERN